VRHSELFFKNGRAHTVSSPCPDRLNLFFGQFCAAVLFAGRVNTSAFIFTISHVVRISSKKQVSRTDAGRIITPMAYVQTLWYFSNVELIRDTMRILHSPGKLEPSVALPIFVCCPVPTAVPLFKLFFKEFLG
jgi:hypothetical protein